MKFDAARLLRINTNKQHSHYLSAEILSGKNAQAIQPNLRENGLDWLCYLASNFQTAPTIFFIFSGCFFLNGFIKNPQTINTRPFLPLNISAVGSVVYFIKVLFQLVPYVDIIYSYFIHTLNHYELFLKLETKKKRMWINLLTCHPYSWKSI